MFKQLLNQNQINMEKYLTIFGLAVLSVIIIYFLTACTRVITSTSKLVTNSSIENNFYILPKKILKATITYEVEEGFDANNNFIKTIGCTVKDQVTLEAQMLPDYDNMYELHNSNPSKFNLKLDYGAEGIGILACLNAEVSPELSDILTGIVSVGAQITSSPLMMGTRDEKVITIAKTVKRDVKIVHFVAPNKLPDLIALNIPKFMDGFQPTAKVLVAFTSDIDDEKMVAFKKKSTYDGIVYHLPIATQVDVLYGSDIASASQISSQIIYFPQFGPLQVVPMSLSYNMFSGKRSINLAFNANTGGLTKVEIARESASKAAFESLKDNIQSVDKGFQDYKNKGTQQAALQKQLDNLKKQKEIKDLQNQIHDMETANAKKN